jgi:hypothetical protein
MDRLEDNRLFRRFYLCLVVRKLTSKGKTMKKLSIALVLLTVGLALFGCQEEKKSGKFLLLDKSDVYLASTSAKQPSFRNEFRFLENEQLYYGMEAERSRMAQAKSSGKLFSANTATAVTSQNSY